MELLKLSKFKLQLQCLTAEVRDLRERERSATEQLHTLHQKQKQNEEEYGRKLQELQAELASSNELRQKLDRQVSYLQNDNAFLERRQKELNDTIQSLLQSREDFINAYQESTCEMKRAIQTRDRKLIILSEKINSHLSLFDSIEKEAFSVKQIVDSVQHLLSEKEEVVARLRSKLESVSVFEKVFVGKICDLEAKLNDHKVQLQRKDKIILELEAELEAATPYLQKTLSTKEVIIQSLISEKEALHFEAGNVRTILQRIQDTVATMNEEDRRAFSSMIECKDGSDIVTTKIVNSIKDVLRSSQDNSASKACGEVSAEHTASPPTHGGCNTLQEIKFNSCMSESACLESQTAANALNISINELKENGRALAHRDSECSTTQAESSQSG